MGWRGEGEWPASKLVECTFSAVTNIVIKERGSLGHNSTHRCYLCLKLTKLNPGIDPCSRASSSRFPLIIELNSCSLLLISHIQ